MHFGQIPAEIKGCQHFMKLAEDHDERNIVVAYYARMAAIQLAMKIVQGTKPPEVSSYLISIMDWLETTKKNHGDVEGIGNETVAQAIIEEYLLKLYNFAYQNDCDETFHKNMVKAYYTASLLCELLVQFGPLSDDLAGKCKIAKYRAAYIHNMLKNGLEPTGINRTVVSNEDEEAEFAISKDEINRRRALRGEDPVSDDVPELDPLEDSARRKAAEDIRTDNDDDEYAELKKIKEAIDSQDVIEEDAGPSDGPLISPERIIDVGPPNYPEPKAEMPRVQPVQPQPSVDLIASTSVASLTPQQNEQAVKYCKWASSALNYDDVKTAILNLEKALYLCKFGQEKP